MTLEDERLMLLRVLDNGESACPDCQPRGVSVTRYGQRWHVAVDHSPSCVVPRRARSKRAYRRWLTDQLAALGVRVAHYGATDDMDLAHR